MSTVISSSSRPVGLSPAAPMVTPKGAAYGWRVPAETMDSVCALPCRSHVLWALGGLMRLATGGELASMPLLCKRHLNPVFIRRQAALPPAVQRPSAAAHPPRKPADYPSRRHVRPPRRLCALGRRVAVAVKSRAAVPRRTAAECPPNRRASCAVRSAAALNGWGGTRGWPQPKALIRCTAPCAGEPERCHDETMRSSALWVVHSADKPCRTSRLHILRAPDDFKYSRKQHPPCTDRVLTLTRRRPGKPRHSAHDPVPQRSHLGRRSGWRRIGVSL
jgi:hypothetical protein